MLYRGLRGSSCDGGIGRGGGGGVPVPVCA